jgi:osmotically-inducible protein OsmY
MKTLQGVTAVDNQITVRPDFAAGDTGERIGWALSRHAGREAHQIAVVVRDGAVDNLEVESGR